MSEPPVEKKRRGFACMTPEKRRELAAKGGKKAQASGRGHQFTSEQATEAGKKGGRAVAAKPDHMSQIGRKGATSPRRKRR